MNDEKREAVDRLKEIQGEMLDLLNEARGLIMQAFGRDSMIFKRADAYWLAHVKIALTKEHGFLGGSMCDFEDTIKECEEDEDA